MNKCYKLITLNYSLCEVVPKYSCLKKINNPIVYHNLVENASKLASFDLEYIDILIVPTIDKVFIVLQ